MSVVSVLICGVWGDKPMMHLQIEKQQQSPGVDSSVDSGGTTDSKHAASLTRSLSTEAWHPKLFSSLDTRKLSVNLFISHLKVILQFYQLISKVEKHIKRVHNI